MSAATGQNHLIAVGSDSPQARLCDIRSGAFAHALTGHSEAVWACVWSPRSEFLLATGSADQTVGACGYTAFAFAKPGSCRRFVPGWAVCRNFELGLCLLALALVVPGVHLHVVSSHCDGLQCLMCRRAELQSVPFRTNFLQMYIR